MTDQGDINAFNDYVATAADDIVVGGAAPPPPAPAAAAAPVAPPSDLPEHLAVPLPALSPTMEMGSIVAWSKAEGDKLEEGDVLCQVGTLNSQ